MFRGGRVRHWSMEIPDSGVPVEHRGHKFNVSRKVAPPHLSTPHLRASLRDICFRDVNVVSVPSVSSAMEIAAADVETKRVRSNQAIFMLGGATMAHGICGELFLWLGASE